MTRHNASFLAFLPLVAALTLPASADHSPVHEVVRRPRQNNTQSVTPKDDRWEKEINAFEEQDRKSSPPADAALFIGSSSIRLWNTLAKDFPEIPVLNRGFGGSELADSTRYIERIVRPYKPRLIVMYAGTNDIANGKTPSQVRDDFRSFVTKVRGSLPNVTIVYLSINPSVARWEQRDRVREANRLIADYTRHQQKLSFVDAYESFLGPDKTPRQDLVVQDNLHLNAEGYKIWSRAVKAIILKEYKRAKPSPR